MLSKAAPIRRRSQSAGTAAWRAEEIPKPAECWKARFSARLEPTAITTSKSHLQPHDRLADLRVQPRRQRHQLRRELRAPRPGGDRRRLPTLPREQRRHEQLQPLQNDPTRALPAGEGGTARVPPRAAAGWPRSRPAKPSVVGSGMHATTHSRPQRGGGQYEPRERENLRGLHEITRFRCGPVDIIEQIIAQLVMG